MHWFLKLIFGIKFYMFRTVTLCIVRSFSMYIKLSVQWKTPDDAQWNCPKYVEFYSKNKFEKTVHLVGFIIRIFHDTRSPERQVRIILHL